MHRDDFQVITGELDNELMRDDFWGITGKLAVEPMLSCNQCQDTDFSEKYELGLEEKS